MRVGRLKFRNWFCGDSRALIVDSIDSVDSVDSIDSIDLIDSVDSVDSC